jgi:hypothetical protein
MLPEHHTARQDVPAPRRLAAGAALAAALLLGPAAPAAAQAEAAPEPQPTAQPSSQPTGQPVPLPRPAAAVAAHTAVRDALLTWSAPDEAALPAVYGAAITLRLDGRVLARGSAIAPDAPGPGPIAKAAADAVRAARSKLPSENDALADERQAELAERITVSLELLGQPVPIPASELALPMAGSSPGAEALVVTDTAGRSLVSGVDAQLTRGADPARELSAMASELTGDGATALRPVPELLERGFRFARAPVVHLATPAEGLAPVFLDRGARVIGHDEVRTGSLRTMADGVAAHLRSRVWPGVERFGLAGDLRVVTGASEPMVAPPFEQGLVAYALLRHAETGGSGAEASRDAAARVLRDLAAVEPAEESPWARPTAAAIVAAALAELDAETRAADSELTALQARVLDTLRGAFDPASGFAADLPPAAKGLIAWAMVRAATLDGTITPARAEGAVRAAFRETPPSQLVSQAPFLIWAELALHPASEGAPIPSAAALAEMRTLVWDHQLRPTDLRPIDRDLAGGIVFTRGRAVLPTWQTMRPLAALATMLRDERLTTGTASSGAVPGEIVRLTEGLRFVRQLAMTGDATWLARRPGQAQWGVRPALWDPTLSLEAGAMALLTACETLGAMRDVAARGTDDGARAQP